MADGLTLILPNERGRERYLLCTSCGAKFDTDHEEKWVRHCVKCVQRNMPNIEEAIAAKESNFFQSTADKELERAVREGRA